jgi:predicted MFS family arabinose efflux permease
MMLAVSAAIRAVLCLFIARNLETLFLYPLAFFTLVLAKGQQVAKSALVPAVVDDERELVLANSRLALISVLAGIAGGLPAAGILKLVGGEWVLRLGAVVFVVAALAALQIPRSVRIGRPETPADRRALHVRSIRLAGTAMGLLRGVVGFTTFFAAIVLKSRGEPAWMYGVVLLASGIGNALGTILAPLLRRRLREEVILVGSMLLPAVAVLFAARGFGRPALAFAGFFIAAGAACGRLAFDSLLQRDAHDAVRGRAFARFETRFQLVWVAGGILGVLFPSGGRAGLFLVALVLGATGLTYLGALRRSSGGTVSEAAG